MQIKCDQTQRFSLRKLSIGLASVLVGASFIVVNAGQQVHADELQTPSQPDSAVQKANNATGSSANGNEQNQTQSDYMAHVVDHIDPNSNLQQNADKSTANVVTDSKENTDNPAKDDANKSQENEVIDRERQATVAFAAKKVNNAITANMLVESKALSQATTTNLPVLNTNDAYALDEKNGLHEHINVNDNGGYDKDFWGAIDLNSWNYRQDTSGNITLTGYKGSDNTKIIVPNIADFAHGNAIKTISLKVDPNVDTDKVYISSSVMHDLARNATRIGLSKTENKKVVASNIDWSNAFGGRTTGPSGNNSDGGIEVLNPNLSIMDLHNLDTSKITNMTAMFNRGTNLKTIGDLSNWDTSKVTNMMIMFQEASSLTNIGNLDDWNTGNVTNMSYMFNKASNLTNIGDLSKWDTSKVIDMHIMFSRASNLTNIGDLSKWNTSNVKDMSWMFSGVSNLTNIGDLSKWDTSKVTNMCAMFSSASSLTNIGNLDNWNTSNVTDMTAMFQEVLNLTNIGDLSKWNTSKVTYMTLMFNGSSNLTNIGDLSKWDTRNVRDIGYMFMNAISLHNLNISNWNLAKLTDKEALKYIFANNVNLTVIANNITLPAWYNNELNNTDYFWNSHMAVITNNDKLLKATGDIDILTIDNTQATRSIFYDSKGSSDAVKVLTDANNQYMTDYHKSNPTKFLKLAETIDTNDPIALANAKFVTVLKEEPIPDNPANHDKLYATATREYIIHNIDGSTTTITQSIGYHRTGTHNFATNEDTFTEWVYSPDENSVIVVVTKDRNNKSIANQVIVEGDNCVERNGKVYFGSIKIKPKAGFKLAVDKPATAKLTTQAKLANSLLPKQFVVLRVFAPMSHTSAKTAKQDHKSKLAEPITSANAIKQGKNVMIKPVVKMLEPKEQATIYAQKRAASSINAFANAESQLLNSQSAENVVRSTQIVNLSIENNQKSAKAKLQHSVTSINGKVKSAEVVTKLLDSHQNKPTLAKKVFAKPTVNILVKTKQPAPEKTVTITNKQTNTEKSLSQTSSRNDLGMAALGLLISSLGITLAGVKNKKHE